MAHLLLVWDDAGESILVPADELFKVWVVDGPSDVSMNHPGGWTGREGVVNNPAVQSTRLTPTGLS